MKLHKFTRYMTKTKQKQQKPN